MKLFEKDDLFHDAIISTADYFKISPAIVEKDYYVTVVLEELKKKNSRYSI